MSIRFSRYFKIAPDALKKEGLLNPFIDRDSKFYIHPNQLRNTKNSFLQTGYSAVQKSFLGFARLIAAINKFDDSDPAYRQVVREFDFPEPPGLCIGYSEGSTEGSGLRGEFARRVLKTAHQISKKARLDPEIFEILPFVEEGIGADRLSDMLSNLIEQNLAALTEHIVTKYKIKKTKTITIGKGKYKVPWYSEKKRYILLLPKDVLSRLPVANSFEEIDELVSHNRRLREIYNQMWRAAQKARQSLGKPDVKRHLKTALVTDTSILADLVAAYKKAIHAGYDFDKDPDNEFKWADAVENLYFTIPGSTKPKSQSVNDIVKYLIERFKEYSEKQKLSSVFFSGANRLKEHFPQQVFNSLAQLYIEDKNLDISPECNLGAGQVDFKFSRGKEKVLIEMKLLSNPAWREGLSKQLTSYYDVEKPQHAYYMAFYIGTPRKKLNVLNSDLKSLLGKYNIQIVTINANKRISASKKR